MNSNYSPTPITAKQAAYLGRLIAQAGKRRYQEIKRQLGLPHVTIMSLSKMQAAQLIERLREAGR